VLRHFLRSASAIAHLAGGVVPPTPERPLIPPAGLPLRLAPLLPGAVIPAVDVPMIAGPADLDLAVTPGAVEEAIPLLDHPTPASRKTGQTGRGRSSWNRVPSQTRPPRWPMKARGMTLLEPSPFRRQILSTRSIRMHQKKMRGSDPGPSRKTLHLKSNGEENW